MRRVKKNTFLPSPWPAQSLSNAEVTLVRNEKKPKYHSRHSYSLYTFSNRLNATLRAEGENFLVRRQS